LVVGEASMVDVPLMHALLKAVPAHAALILLDDVDQLPSVGLGQALADAATEPALYRGDPGAAAGGLRAVPKTSKPL
jgi:ATP-dependent exoDNAse (exonuclease V) alpha subunit